MKIAFISSDNNATSGAFLSLANLAKELKKMGVDSCIFIPVNGPYIGPRNGVKLLKEYNLSYSYIPSYSWIVPTIARHKILWFIRQQFFYPIVNKIASNILAKKLKKNNFDIVHINTSYSYFGALAASKAKLPLVWHIREFLEEDQKNQFYNKEFAHKLINTSDLIITISKSINEKYKNIFSRHKTKTIYNGIDTDTFYLKDRSIFNNNIINFVYIGSIFPNKGVMDIVDAAIKLNLEGYSGNFKLTIYGEGSPEYKTLIINKIKPFNNIKYNGPTANVVSVLKQNDVTIVASHFEAFGRITVESMLSGNLVLGSDSAGTKELLQDGNLGLLYKVKNVESLASKMEYIISAKTKLRKIAHDGQEYMFNNMSAQLNAKKIYDEYIQLLKTKEQLSHEQL